MFLWADGYRNKGICDGSSTPAGVSYFDLINVCVCLLGVFPHYCMTIRVFIADDSEGAQFTQIWCILSKLSLINTQFEQKLMF